MDNGLRGGQDASYRYPPLVNYYAESSAKGDKGVTLKGVE
jgi:hypothetical protein